MHRNLARAPGPKVAFGITPLPTPSVGAAAGRLIVATLAPQLDLRSAGRR